MKIDYIKYFCIGCDHDVTVNKDKVEVTLNFIDDVYEIHVDCPFCGKYTKILRDYK